MNNRKYLEDLLQYIGINPAIIEDYLNDKFEGTSSEEFNSLSEFELLQVIMSEIERDINMFSELHGDEYFKE